MDNLSDTWFIEGNIDLESKTYTLLAYLQKVNALFGEFKLYPQLGNLVFHYNNLIAFKQKKQVLQRHFPKRLTGIQMQRLELIYEEMLSDDDLMEEIESIVQVALQNFEKVIADGTGRYDEVEQQLQIVPVGIVPQNIFNGYLMLADHPRKTAQVYEYQRSIFERADQTYHSLRTKYINAWALNLTTTYESIKAELVRSRPERENPAMYAIESRRSYPVEETLLPVAKRIFVQYINGLGC